MSDMIITIETPDGDVVLPVPQAMRMADAIRAINDAGGKPVWHFQDCGECVCVHKYGASAGWVIGPDGGADWVEVGKHDQAGGKDLP